MKKFITTVVFLVAILLTIVCFPRTKEHAVVVTSNDNYSEIYVSEKLYKVKFDKKYPVGTVINYNYNFFKAFNVKVLSPIEERVMKTNNGIYDLELSGELKADDSITFYYLDKNNNIYPLSKKKILIGKENIKTYLNKKNNIKTFIITPYDLSSMRVGISTTGFNSLKHSEIDLTCLEEVNLYNLKENYKKTIPKNTKIKISALNDKIEFNIDNQIKVFSSRTYLKGNNIKIDNITRGIPKFTPSYSGTLEFTNDKNSLYMINEVDMEEYLFKVVPSEMPSSGGLESLKCQAIAARTYALSDMLQNRFAHLGFYVDDSTQSQVYNNMETNELASRAVLDTKGLIMTSNNEPIDAKYYSSSAGVATAYEDVWFNADWSSENKNYYYKGSYVDDKSLPNNENEWLSFYKNKDLKAIDSESPYFRWYAHFSKNALENSLKKSLKIIHERRPNFIEILQNNAKINDIPELGNIKDIKVLKRSEFGNIMEISFLFTNITVNVKGDYNIRSAIRCNKDFSGEIIPIIRHKKEPLINSNFLPSSFFAIEKDSEGFTIYGGGYGHGVGMTQNGAMEMSKKGSSYEEILGTFYKDVKIEKIY
ncbi:SpoIID/LytB domain-containing protein [Clostridium sp. MSJ-11]|uniref:SpoIID/LytB domain-containing protein n=1 Tax=Clostridium mobile TaxID=2841512 RepID=A0ABS6EPH8_9CLOT|nr:SpoIID/LytB domain-containing protein [Clostridium mobile]MBU5486295.1 SpoIID/LytB domain-containing protein [Clostridium mobile]